MYKFQPPIFFVCLVLLMYNIGCKSHNGKFEKEMLYGKWVPTKDTIGPKSIFIDKAFYRQEFIDTTNGRKEPPDTLWTRYSLKEDTLTFHLTSVWDIDEKIICLNADSLIYQSVDDCRVFTYVRSK